MSLSISTLRQMPEDNLVRVAARKNRIGNASFDARRAQEILWERSFKAYTIPYIYEDCQLNDWDYYL